MLLLALLAPAAPVRAQDATVVPRSDLERRLEGEILCTCGCRRALDNCGMPNCHGHEEQTVRLRQYLAEGKDHDAIIAAFIKEFGGQDILAVPVDEGFNRLAWFFPYAVGLTGALGVAFVAMRWSRRGHDAEAEAAGVTEDSNLQSRLDDELRDLD
jgi:hypothetical protein